MTTAAEAIEAIRLALDAGPTPGPWRRNRTFGQLNVQDERYMLGDQDAAYIAAANPEALRAILDRMAELERANAWQPIETAPRDGSRILAYRAEWSEDMSVCWWNNGEQCWATIDGGEFCDVTHWRPLLSAPDAKEQA